MTFNKMRFPIVWITLALCVVLCAIEVHSGPVDHQDLTNVTNDLKVSARQEPYSEDSDEEDDDEEGGDDGGDGDNDDGEDEERAFKRLVREAVQKPYFGDEQSVEDSVIPSTDAPNTDEPTKKPSSVLLLLSDALEKAIAATTTIPTQQIASNAASAFYILGQVFSEAIDKVIGDDDGPEESATEINITDATDIPDEELLQLPTNAQTEKVEKQPEINSSRNDMHVASRN